MKNKFLPTALVAVVVFGTSTFAQESHDSQHLFELLQSAQATVTTGTVKLSEEKPDSPFGGVFGAQITVMGGGSAAEPYLGELDVFRRDGALAAVSTGGLPQLKVYRKGGENLVRQTYKKSPVDAKNMINLLAKATDFELLAKKVKQAKRVRSKDNNGAKQYRVTVDAEYFEPDEDENDGHMGRIPKTSMFNEAVLEGILIVNADEDGGLKSLELKIQYNDPMAGVFEQAFQGGGGPIEIGPGNMKKSDKPGRKMTVTFTVSEESKAAKAFAQEAQRLLK